MKLLLLLERSWRIVHGLVSFKELQLTVTHTCAFHFMHNAKEILKKTMLNEARSDVDAISLNEWRNYERP